MGLETYIIMVAPFKKKNTQCITFADCTQHTAMGGRWGQDLPCPARGLELHQPLSKSASQLTKDTDPHSAFRSECFRGSDRTPPAQKLTR